MGQPARRLLCSLADRHATGLRSEAVLGHILLTTLGLLLIVLGFWGGHIWSRPYDTLAAWCAPIGLVLTLVGIVLLFIPNFFT